MVLKGATVWTKKQTHAIQCVLGSTQITNGYHSLQFKRNEVHAIAAVSVFRDDALFRHATPPESEVIMTLTAVTQIGIWD